MRGAARADAPAPAAFLAAVYRRTPRFSGKLAGARLSSSERKLLALLDGETPMAAILERAGLAAARAASAASRLCAVGLIRPIRPIQPYEGEPAGPPPEIALWSPGDGDFERALRALLRRRTPPIDVLPLDPGGDLAAEILRARPRLILVADPPSAATGAMVDAARASASALIGVLDAASRDAADACLAAGYHAVLARPIHLDDLERLLPS
jgi:hypothetical protein